MEPILDIINQELKTIAQESRVKPNVTVLLKKVAIKMTPNDILLCS